MRGGQLTGLVVSRRERHPLLAAAGLVLALLVAACGSDGEDDDGYGPGERSDFVEACAASPGGDEDACGCFYDRLAAELPHERFVEVDEQIRDDPTAIPDDITDMAVGCSAQPDSGGGPG